MKLTELDCRVLRAVALRADLPLARIAKELRVREHRVRYSIGVLKERGILSARLPTLNLHKLGFTDFGIFFSRSDNKLSREKFLAAVQRLSRVAWAVELGGEFQYAIAILGRNIVELRDLLSELSRLSTGRIVEKSIATRVSWEAYEPKYLLPSASRPGHSIGIRGGESLYNLHPSDHLILKAFTLNGELSNSAIAREVGIPVQTVEYRINKMRKDGLITGIIWRINPARIGSQAYRVIVAERGVESGFELRLLRFCRIHPNILSVVRCLGDWDFELRVEATSAVEAGTVVRDLHDQFADAISSIRVFSLFEVHKLSHYPFESYEDALGQPSR